MYSTREVLHMLRAANPGAGVTEEQIRRVLRREEIPLPDSFAGRLAWTDEDVLRLADCLGLVRTHLSEASRAASRRRGP